MAQPRVQTFDLTALPEKLREPVQQSLVKPLRLFMDEAARAIGKAWTQGETLAFYEGVRVDVPDEWLTPTFQNSWSDGAGTGDPSVAYRKTENGDLEFRGFPAAPGGGAVSGNEILSIANSSFWPAGRASFVCRTTDITPGLNVCYVSMEADGRLIWDGGTTDAGRQVAISSVRVPCADRQPYQAATPYNFPVELPWTLERAPIGVCLLEARERNPSGGENVRSPVGGVDWEVLDRGAAGRRLNIRLVTGLAPGKSYTLRLLAVGG